MIDPEWLDEHLRSVVDRDLSLVADGYRRTHNTYLSPAVDLRARIYSLRVLIETRPVGGRQWTEIDRLSMPRAIVYRHAALIA